MEMYGRAGGGEVVGEDGGSSERRMGSGIKWIKWKARQGLGGWWQDNIEVNCRRTRRRTRQDLGTVEAAGGDRQRGSYVWVGKG
jgi:hypothetical protein